MKSEILNQKTGNQEFGIFKHAKTTVVSWLRKGKSEEDIFSVVSRKIDRQRCGVLIDSKPTAQCSLRKGKSEDNIICALEQETDRQALGIRKNADSVNYYELRKGGSEDSIIFTSDIQAFEIRKTNRLRVNDGLRKGKSEDNIISALVQEENRKSFGSLGHSNGLKKGKSEDNLILAVGHAIKNARSTVVHTLRNGIREDKEKNNRSIGILQNGEGYRKEKRQDILFTETEERKINAKSPDDKMSTTGQNNDCVLKNKRHVKNLYKDEIYCTYPETEGDSELFGYGDITKSHYKETNGRRSCNNQHCNAVFSFKVHPHHCRRCGEVFCSSCLRLRRKLNRLAQPDPGGLLCKVCETCFREDVESHNITKRSLTEEFMKTRTMARREQHNLYCDLTMERNKSSVIPAFWRQQFEINIPQECRRLLEGFSLAMLQSEKYINKTLQELRNHIEVPAWQRSVYWALEKAVTSCRICHTRFRKFHTQQKLRNCRVCGLALCKTCSNKELLLYFEDEANNSEIKRPKMAIIKFVGSPEVEPEMSVLLYVCNDCKSEVLQKQLEDPEWFEEKPKPLDVLAKIAELHEELTAVQETILDRESQIQQLIQETERNIQAEDERGIMSLGYQLHNHSVNIGALRQAIDILNKAEARLLEIPDHIQKVKHLRQSATSKQTQKLIQNVIKGKSEFYLQRKQIIRELKIKIQTLQDK